MLNVLDIQNFVLYLNCQTKTKDMKNYLTLLITEKGLTLENEITLEGHFGLTYQMLVDYIVVKAKAYHGQIRTTLVKIDFMNGDVFHYLDYLAAGMVKAVGY